MSNNKEVMTPFAIMIAEGNGKKITRYIADTLKAYTGVASRLHVSAVVAFYHAAQYGQADYLNKLHAGLRVNDQRALRTWAGNLSAYDVTGEDGIVESKNWMRFHKERFHVRKGTADFRVDRYDPVELLDGSRFIDNNNNATDDPFTTDKLAAMLAGIRKRINGQIDKNKEAEATGNNVLLEIPASLDTALKGLEKVAASITRH